MLEGFGVFTLSNCWHDKKRSIETCEECKRPIRLEPDNCENSASHPGESHMESFEDVVNADDQLPEINGKFSADKAFGLLNDHPKPSAKFGALLTKVDSWLIGSSQIKYG